MTFDTTTIILIVLIVAGLLIMALGLMARRKAAPKTERRLGEDGSPYVASPERPYMTPPPPPPAPIEPAPEPAAAVEAAPEDWRAWYRLAVAYGDARDPSRGRRTMRKAIALQRAPKPARARRNGG